MCSCTTRWPATWNDVEGAEKFAGGWETREAMEWATSGRQPSEIWVIEKRLEVEV
jgi:hypothetical protein